MNTVEHFHFTGTAGEVAGQAEQFLLKEAESDDPKIAAQARLNLALLPAFMKWINDSAGELKGEDMPPLIVAALSNLLFTYVANAVKPAFLDTITYTMLSDLTLRMREHLDKIQVPAGTVRN